MRRYLKYVNTTIVISDFYKKCAEDANLFSNIKVIHNGIKLLEYKPVKNWNNILYVGRLEDLKGIDDFIEALALVKKIKSGIRAVLAGNGSKIDFYKNKVKKLGLEDAVFFKGYQSPERISKLYKESTLVVVPSLIPDNLPLVCMEAMATGRPVIGTRIGGIPEMIVEGKTGYMFESNNYSELSSIMCELLDDEEKIKLMGRAGRQRAARLFDIDQCIEKTIQEYEDLLLDKLNIIDVTKN